MADRRDDGDDHRSVRAALFLQGQLGDFFRVLPLVCVAAMTMSMIEALIILPSHLSELPDLRKKPVQALFAAKKLGPIRKLRDGFLKVYRGFLTFLVDVLYDRSSDCR